MLISASLYAILWFAVSTTFAQSHLAVKGVALPELSPTAYAVLGLLAMRSWSTYELAKQMERSLHHFWPRAERGIYEEPKRLVAHGLARSRTEHHGRRPRTVYSITPKGRRAFARWLDGQATGPILECEALVKVFFAEQGTKDTLQSNIQSIAQGANDLRQLVAARSSEQLQNGGAFPERLAIITLVAGFLARYSEAVAEWAQWADREVSSWPDDLLEAQPNAAVLRQLATN